VAISTPNPDHREPRTLTDMVSALDGMDILLNDLRIALLGPSPAAVEEEHAEFIDRCRRAADHEARHDEPDVYAVWALGFLRGIPDPTRRHVALDAVLAALDHRDAER
jgi:hypothetical protein